MYGGTSDDRAYWMEKTIGGGYIIAGSTNSFGAGGKDIYLIKTNNNGDTLWTKTYGMAGDEQAWSVRQLQGGGYIMAGYTNSTGAGGLDVYLLKTDANGNLIWAKTFGGTSVEDGFSVEETNDRGYILAGATESFGSGLFDVYVIKTDSAGTMQWAKTYGDTLNDYGQTIHQTTDGGYIIGGSTGSFGAVGSDAYLIKTDSAGGVLWSKTFGGVGNDYTYSVQQLSSGGYILCGQTTSFGAGMNDLYLIRTDSVGNLVWSKTYGGTNNDYGYTVEQLSSGGFIIGGLTTSFTGGGAYIIKTDGSGTLSWSKAIGRRGYDLAYSVLPTSDGGYVIGGYTDTLGTGANYNFYLIKTDSTGAAGGCNESSPNTITSSPATQSATVTTKVLSVNTITSPPVPAVHSGGTATTLCSVILDVNKPEEKSNP